LRQVSDVASEPLVLLNNNLSLLVFSFFFLVEAISFQPFGKNLVAFLPYSFFHHKGIRLSVGLSSESSIADCSWPEILLKKFL
jgi:hypothetical protein